MFRPSYQNVATVCALTILVNVAQTDSAGPWPRSGAMVLVSWAGRKYGGINDFFVCERGAVCLSVPVC